MKNSSLDKEMLPCNQLVSKKSSEEKSHKKVAKKFAIMITKSQCNILRTFALIVCAQPFCAGNATVICHASLRLTGPEDKHGVENAGEKDFRPSLLLWIIGDPYFFNHESLTLLTIYKI